MSRHLIKLVKIFLTTKITQRLKTDSTDIVNKTNSNLRPCLQILIVKFLCAEQSGIYQHLPQLLIDPTRSCMQWTFLPKIDFYIKKKYYMEYSHKYVTSYYVKDLSKYASKLTFDYCIWRTWGKTARKKNVKNMLILRCFWYHAIKLYF